MSGTRANVFDELRRTGWEVVLLPERRPMPVAVTSRYPWLPSSFLTFAEHASSIVLPSQQTWILTVEDYAGREGAAWRWNEFELMELGWADEAHDVDERQRIERFWAQHLPILMACFGDYAYVALEGPTGAVVGAWSDAFQETRLIAPSFEAFLAMLIRREPAVGQYLK